MSPNRIFFEAASFGIFGLQRFGQRWLLSASFHSGLCGTWGPTFFFAAFLGSAVFFAFVGAVFTAVFLACGLFSSRYGLFPCR
jgi:hypothetical protein